MTAFFVEPTGRDDSDNEAPERLDLELLAIGKKIGLTFGELNMLRVKDLVKLVDIYAGKGADKPRTATQADFDSFAR